MKPIQNKLFRIVAALSLVLPMSLHAQKTASMKDLRWNLNEDGSHFIKFTVFNQVWMRYTDANPGSTVYGDPVSKVYDIGIRRLRIQAFGQLSDRVFIYTQFGQNNFTYTSPRFAGAFFHDAVAEYKVYRDKISIGSGLTGWSGLSRYASPAIGSIMTLDAPLYQQATNSTTDQFLRKLSIYAKGKISGLDYRIAITHPMAAQNANVANTTKFGSDASFSPKYPKMQTQAYVKWEFFDKESNLIPYLPGCYLGTKKVFNIGAGFIMQPRAMWQSGSHSYDTIFHAMNLFNADVYLDLPINKDKGNAITFYGAYSKYDFGRNYVRMIGAMNPTLSTNANAIVNGTGNAFPTIGTGNIYYVQAGYLFGKKLLPGDARLQVFAASQYSKFNGLHQPGIMAEGGLNYFINGTHNNKITVEYQSRPIYTNVGGEKNVTSHKGMAVIQFQVGI